MMITVMVMLMLMTMVVMMMMIVASRIRRECGTLNKLRDLNAFFGSSS